MQVCSRHVWRRIYHLFFILVSTSNFVEYDPIAAAKGFTELPPEPSKGKFEIH